MILTDHQYKTLLDAQAVLRHLVNVFSMSTAQNAAEEIERTIERCERERNEAQQTAPF